MKKLYYFIIFSIFFSCDPPKQVNELPIEPEKRVEVPAFNKDSSFQFLKKQLNFGYRIPGTEAHQKTGDYLVAKLKSWGAVVFEQNFRANTWDGQNVPLRNIIASFYPDKTKRILLAAHWDSRPFGDKDLENPGKPIDGANDGASGVAVLLEIARNMALSAPSNVGVDFIFFDGEDWGETIDTGYIPPAEGYESWWCLGSQYWSKNKHIPNYSAYYGILLDMVGARNSHFFVEGGSEQYAPKIVDRVWGTAKKLGYNSIFVDQKRGAITDDHVYVNELAKIPMIDIVHYDPVEGYFGNYHHTQKDNIDIIDPNMLQVVGQTVMYVVYHE